MHRFLWKGDSVLGHAQLDTQDFTGKLFFHSNLLIAKPWHKFDIIVIWDEPHPRSNFFFILAQKYTKFPAYLMINGNRISSSKEDMAQICKKCHKKQIERKEAIVELIQTEINYGQDLRILKEVFIVMFINIFYVYMD